MKKEKKEEKKVFTFEKNRIKFILLKSKDKEIAIEKNEDGNWIIKDKNYECDKDEIEGLISRISSLEIERDIGKVEDLSIYGLLTPEKSIEIHYDGEKETLYIGDETPSGSYLYTTKDKNDVFLVYKWDLNNILEKKEFDLRDRRIIQTEIYKSEVEEIEIKKEKLVYLFRKYGEKWYIENPIKDLASKEKIERIIENLIDQKVNSFEENKGQKECGLENPKIIFKIKVRDKEYFVFLGKKEKDKYYSKSSLKPYIFLVDDRIVNDISDNIDDLRERKVFDINVSNVVEFSIIRKDKELKIVKEKERYYFEKDRKKKISKDKVEEFLHNLKYLEIDEFIDYSPERFNKFSLSLPLLKIIVKDEKSKIEVNFGKKIEDKIFCYHPERKIIFTISSSDYEKIDKEEKFFIEKEEKKNE
ncbi:MAG: DUF4340 domain-containing protein [Candidatus Omnitrophica bacterium]|nr:DUF4340 domain-containing protein [Candidatus Omnitrophota bacterium]